ncbi:MAG: hypothetical protein EHM20_16940 [Alphaproteobacteria bacterium]|nr:MAG: hypothetical protein EHM20_16940 [Alphaproteobacteria bacterium]
MKTILFVRRSYVADDVDSLQPYCIDISSGVEANYIKDREKIIEVVNLVRSLDK